MSSGFQSDHDMLRWVASQFPNVPSLQSHLRQVAERLEQQSAEAAAVLASGAVEVAEVVAESSASE